MKFKILTKLTSLTVSFALCLSVLFSKNLSVQAYGGDFPIVSKSYNYKSIKKLFTDIKDPEKVALFLDKQRKENKGLISKFVFSIGAVAILGKLGYNLYKAYEDNKNISEKENKNKKHTDDKSFWTKIKDNLGVFKDKFLGYTALITLGANLLICCINSLSYYLKIKKVRKEKPTYFWGLKQLFDCEDMDETWNAYFFKITSNVKILKDLMSSCNDEKATFTKEEEANFDKDLKKIRSNIKKTNREILQKYTCFSPLRIN